MNDKSWATTFSALFLLSVIGALASWHVGESRLMWPFIIDAAVNAIAMSVAICRVKRGEDGNG